MPHRYPHLLASGHIGALEIRNRIVMPAMDQNNCTDQGLVAEATVAHYEERAAGGAGLLILETSAVLWPPASRRCTRGSLVWRARPPPPVPVVVPLPVFIGNCRVWRRVCVPLSVSPV